MTGIPRLKDRIAIVTGGASGIGEASVRRFIAEGARVMIVDIDAERGESLAAELGEDAAFLRTDLQQPEECAKRGQAGGGGGARGGTSTGRAARSCLARMRSRSEAKRTYGSLRARPRGRPWTDCGHSRWWGGP